VEVYNDLNGELVHCFRMLKERPGAVTQELEGLLNSRQLFEEFRRQDPAYLTDAQRAARFVYLLHYSYGARGQTYGTGRRRPKIFLPTLLDRLRQAYHRLTHVTIEHLDFAACLRRYDGPETVFFADPPYLGRRHYPGPPGGLYRPEEQRRLAQALHAAQGKILLTLNDAPLIRELYADWERQTVPVRYQLDVPTGSITVPTLILRNYSLPASSPEEGSLPLMLPGSAPILSRYWSQGTQ
jgi:DNA adenine methylase